MMELRRGAVYDRELTERAGAELRLTSSGVNCDLGWLGPVNMGRIVRRQVELAGDWRRRGQVCKLLIVNFFLEFLDKIGRNYLANLREVTDPLAGSALAENQEQQTVWENEIKTAL
ncbi:hypothetical protein DVH05_004310 [Phytophthora capsici]|nr:hypothetical protein DVH05_004310 [Phytophthora capsici]